MTRTPAGGRTAFTIIATLTLAIASAATPAAAISIYNSRPAPERTNVGEMFGLYDRDGNGTFDRFVPACSGTMISPSVYLTAAHCVALWPTGTRFYVSLDEDVLSERTHAAALGLSGMAEADWFVAHGHAVEGDAHWDPAVGLPKSNTHDIAVIDFARRATTPADIWTFTPASMPSADQLSALGPRALANDPWTTVGYGSQQADNSGGGRPTFPGGDVRLEASMGFDAITGSWVKLGANESRGFGSACYGDSGGPNFVSVNGAEILASTTVTGDAMCYATNVTYRMDTPTARTFLAQFVTLP